MKAPNVTVLKKYLTAMSKHKVKYMTCERLAHIIGVYPEVIADNLSYFEPMLKMDTSLDLLQLIPMIKDYIIAEEDKKAKQPKVVALKKDIVEYESIADFIYKKMTYAGLIDRSTVLNEKDLKILKRLVTMELTALKKKK